MSLTRGLNQPITRSLITIASNNIYSLSSLTTQLTTTAVAQQIGSLFVCSGTTANINTAFGAASTVATPAAGRTLTDLGKTVTIEIAAAASSTNDGACVVRLREVKYQTATSTFVTGYVVVENNYQLANALVTVARA
jgi:hypothetical protein